MSNREKFEKLPEIAERLHTVVYNEDLNQYHAAMINSGLSVKYIQGAWYAFQEQQEKIDAVLHAIAQSELYSDRDIWGLRDEIKELLK